MKRRIRFLSALLLFCLLFPLFACFPDAVPTRRPALPKERAKPPGIPVFTLRKIHPKAKAMVFSPKKKSSGPPVLRWKLPPMIRRFQP